MSRAVREGSAEAIRQRAGCVRSAISDAGRGAAAKCVDVPCLDVSCAGASRERDGWPCGQPQVRRRAVACLGASRERERERERGAAHGGRGGSRQVKACAASWRRGRGPEGSSARAGVAAAAASLLTDGGTAGIGAAAATLRGRGEARHRGAARVNRENPSPHPFVVPVNRWPASLHCAGQSLARIPSLSRASLRCAARVAAGAAERG